MRKITLFILVFFQLQLLHGQNWQWGKKLSPDSGSPGYSFFIPSNPSAGNIYVYCSNYNSSPDEIRHFTSGGNNDWTLALPGNFRFMNMVADSLGNLIACGYWMGQLNFANSQFTSSGNEDAIFFKISPASQFLFVNTIQGPKEDIAYSVAVNNLNEIYVATLLRDSMYSGANKIYADTSITETVIGKYDAVGNLISAFKESYGQYYYGIDNIKMLIGGSGNIYFISNIGYYTAYSYAKVFSPTGAVLGGMQINDGIYDIAIDSGENPYIIRNTGSHYSGNPVLLKCDPQLTIMWNKSLGGSYDTYALTAISIDNHNRLFLPGRNGNSFFGYSGSNTFGNQTLNYSGPNTALLAEMDTAGNYINVIDHAVKESR